MNVERQFLDLLKGLDVGSPFRQSGVLTYNVRGRPKLGALNPINLGSRAEVVQAQSGPWKEPQYKSSSSANLRCFSMQAKRSRKRTSVRPD